VTAGQYPWPIADPGGNDPLTYFSLNQLHV
jgi:hypothetical protein